MLTTAPAAPAAEATKVDWRLRFLVLAVIWGGSFLFIKVAVEVLAPIQVTLGRCLLGAVAVGAVLAVRREPLPRDARTWLHLAVAALLLNVIPFTLFGYAEERIPSALAGICNSATPLFTVAVAVLALPDERPTRRRAAGLALGFGGVLVVLGVWNGVLGHDATGTLMALAAALCYGLGWTYVRRFVSGSHSTFALTTAQLIAASVQLVVLAAVFTPMPAHLPLRVVLAVAALGALGTGAAYVLQHGLIRDAGATVASTVTYVAPMIAVLIGVVVLGERLTWNAPVGAAVIIAGAVLISGARISRRTPESVRLPTPPRRPSRQRR
ncbi:MAG TPA: DMT family transporter [Streptosporangiaceae bacterium]